MTTSRTYTNADVERAVRFAVVRHQGQEDKAGKPYVFHPLHVMLQFQDPLHQIVAVLHDTIEDTSATVASLRETLFLGDDVLDAIDAISRREGEEYQDYIKRLARNPIARAVKLEDLRHNMDLTRMAGRDPSWVGRLVPRYLTAYAYLTEHNHE